MQDYDENGINHVTDAGAVYYYKRNTTQQWVFKQKIVAPVRDSADRFGDAISGFGQYLVIGKPFDDLDEKGFNYLNGSGSAYIFKEDASGDWVFHSKLSAEYREVGMNFGSKVFMSENRLAVSAFRSSTNENNTDSVAYSGSVFIYERMGDDWQFKYKVVASDRNPGEEFGRSLFHDSLYWFIGSGNMKVSGLNTAGSCRFYLNPDHFTGEEELSENLAGGINIFPNPSNGTINIRSNEKIERVILFSVHGKLLREYVINEYPQSLTISFPPDLLDGLYLIKLEGERNHILKKVILKRI